MSKTLFLKKSHRSQCAFINKVFIGMVVFFASCLHGKHTNDGISVSDSIQTLMQVYHRHINSFPDSAFNSAEKALRLSLRRHDDPTTMYDIFFALGIACEKLEQYDLAIAYFSKVIEYSKNVAPSQLATAHDCIGKIAIRLKKYNMAMEHFHKAMEICIYHNDLEGQALSYRLIGFEYQCERKFEEAEAYYRRSMQLYEQLDCAEGKANVYHDLGELYVELGECDRALEFFHISEQYCRDLDNSDLFLNVIYHTGKLMQDLRKHDKACRDFFKKLNNTRTRQNPLALTEAYYSFEHCLHTITDKADSAIYYLGLVVEMADQFDLDEIKYRALTERAGIKARLFRYAEATTDYELAINVSEQLNRKKQEKAGLFTQRFMQYEADVLLEQQNEREHIVRVYIAALVCLVLLVVAIVIIIYQKYRRNNRSCTLLAGEHVIIKNQHREITESICAASLLQKAVMPPKEYMDDVFPEHFILNMPYDTISGDFYWVIKKEPYTVVAVADCTGHGVPGGVISMLGISSLNKIVSEMEIPYSDAILNRLREMIILLLNSYGTESSIRNGMDMSLVVINTLTHKIDFTGAQNSIYWIHRGELIEKKAKRMSIGVDERQHRPFVSQRFVYTKGDLIYMFSDGYVDQFDHTNQEKFKKKRFKDLLLSISAKPMQKQLSIIEKTHFDWRGSTKQTDDILVLGIKL